MAKAYNFTMGHKTMRERLTVAMEAARAAGQILLGDMRLSGGPRGKRDKADADSEAEAVIRDRIEAAFPADGIVGEELGLRDRAPRDGSDCVWFIDPNDGTQAYLEGFRGASVSIGVVRGGVPVLGVVFAYGAPDDGGDFFAWAEGCGPLLRNGRPVTRGWPGVLTHESVVLVSQHADQKASVNAQIVSPARFRAVPSVAYRLALCAAGDGDVAVSLAAPGAWDCAAGHALLRAVGGELCNEQGQPVTYKEPWSSDVFGGAPAIAPALSQRAWDQIFCNPREQESEIAGLVLDLQAPKRGWHVSDVVRLSRAQGCLLGQLGGDALGSLVEFEDFSRIAKKYPDGGPHLLKDGGTWSTIAGQPTDDSELALCLARALLHGNRFDLETIAQAYAGWYTSGPFDMGTTTRQALSAAYQATKTAGPSVSGASQAAANAHSQANGALMRVSPLAVFSYRCDPATIASRARLDASLTHPHPVCQDANAVFCVAIAAALQSHTTPSQVYEAARSWAEAQKLSPSVFDALEAAASSPPSDFMSQQGWVIVAFQNAFYQLLHAPSLAAGVTDTVRRGGDTDTNGAIAGALLGAVHGASAIPPQWVNAILTCRPLQHVPSVRHPRPRRFWPVDVLLLAEHLLLAEP